MPEDVARELPVEGAFKRTFRRPVFRQTVHSLAMACRIRQCLDLPDPDP